MSEEVKQEYHIGEYAIRPDWEEETWNGEMESEDLRWAVSWAEAMSFLFGFTLALLILTWYGVIVI